MPKKRKPEDFSFRPFSNLKKIIIAETAFKTSPKDKPPKPACSDDEELFRREMKDVREIEEFRRLPVRHKGVTPVKKASDPDRDALKALEEISCGKRPIRLEDTQEYVEWTNTSAGYTPAIARKLHEGGFAVQDFLDLHGFTIDEAETLVDRFLKASLMKGLRCVKIIHGRGLKSPAGPVLKEALLKWLTGRFRKNVMAFSTARRFDGGLGALYILLRQHRRRN